MYYIQVISNFFESISTFSVVELKQHQHLNPQIMVDSTLSLEDAIVINDTTVAMLRKVVNYYNNLGKTIILIGHSFGAFLLPEYLDDYGISDIHRIIPMSGRLNMNQEVVDAFASGYYAEFTNGVDVVVQSSQASSDEWAAMKLMAVVGYNRYVDSLAAMNLSKLMYVYGTHDAPVGRLLQNEIDLLQATGAYIYAIQNGSHDSPFAILHMRSILSFIRNPITTSLSKSLLSVNKVKMYPTKVSNTLKIDAAEGGVLEIINMNGQSVCYQKCELGFNQIDLSHLIHGLYIAIYISVSQDLTIKKILKQ